MQKPLLRVDGKTRVKHQDGMIGRIIGYSFNGLCKIRRADGYYGRHYLIDNGGYTKII